MTFSSKISFKAIDNNKSNSIKKTFTHKKVFECLASASAQAQSQAQAHSAERHLA